MDNLPAKVLIGIDIISPEAWCIDFQAKNLIMPHCASLKFPIITHSNDSKFKSTLIYAKYRIVVPAYSHSLVPIPGKNDTPLELPDGDLIFQPNKNQILTMFTHIIYKNTQKIPVQNNCSKPCVLTQNTLLGEVTVNQSDRLTELSSEAAYFSEVYPSNFIDRLPVKKALAHHATTISLAYAINETRQELVTPNGVTIYGNPDKHRQL